MPRDIQGVTEIIIRSPNVEKTHTQKKNILEKIKFINSQIQKYDDGIISRFGFIKILTNKFKPKK